MEPKKTPEYKLKGTLLELIQSHPLYSKREYPLKRLEMMKKSEAMKLYEYYVYYDFLQKIGNI